MPGTAFTAVDALRARFADPRARRAPFFATDRFADDFAADFAGLLAAGIGYLPPFGADVFLSTGFPPVCPRKSRVGANSPSLCPTMFSVT